eukprot:2391009-Amphidinium_carterae.1
MVPVQLVINTSEGQSDLLGSKSSSSLLTCNTAPNHACQDNPAHNHHEHGMPENAKTLRALRWVWRPSELAPVPLQGIAQH